jgi:hypothetical protein
MDYSECPIIQCPVCGKEYHDIGEAFPCDCGEGLGNEHVSKMIEEPENV